MQGVCHREADVVQRLAFTQLARLFEHRRAVVQCGDLMKATGQIWQKAAIAGADFQGGGRWGEAQFVEQGQDTVPVLRQTCDQILLSAKLLCNAREEVLTGCGPLPVYRADSRCHVGWQGQVVDLFQQGSVQLAAQLPGMGQGAAVKNGIALATRCHKPSLRQHFEVMAHPGLAGGKNVRQFQHAK